MSRSVCNDLSNPQITLIVVIKGINAKSEILMRKRKVEGTGRGKERKRTRKKKSALVSHFLGQRSLLFSFPLDSDSLNPVQVLPTGCEETTRKACLLTSDQSKEVTQETE